LPDSWLNEYDDLEVIPNTAVAVRPLYAVWLQNSDQQTWIRQLLKQPVSV
jgi:hypothetical protein